jgi:hypothetical protein
MVEQEDRNFFVGLLPNIHCAMNAVRRFVPTNLPRRNRKAIGLTSVTVFDGKHVAGQHHRNSAKWVSMPGQCFAESQALATNKGCSMVKKDFLAHQ